MKKPIPSLTRLFMGIVALIIMMPLFMEVLEAPIALSIAVIVTGLFIFRDVINLNMFRKPESILENIELQSVEGLLQLEQLARQTFVGNITSLSFKVNDKPIDVTSEEAEKLATLGTKTYRVYYVKISGKSRFVSIEALEIS